MLVATVMTIQYAYAQDNFKGEVISLDSYIMGGTGKVAKDKAKTLADAGHAIVFKSGNKIYFVYNEDGSFAGKRLANFATAELVGIVGKTKTVHGLNIIVVSMIDAI
ncbi:MAG: hypothetical protein CVV22_12645 [Ignavibacteriae bacterium HGW-Ignavibacteriae-1]|nr:MAG: hypothetical protein CVV22_12645 [Ignavibacteriae bacterium HGW-Ignavibacteriae-1]